MKAATGKIRQYLHEKHAEKPVRLSRSRAGNIGVAVLLLLVCCFMFVPMLYSIVQSLKPLDEIFAYPPRFFVKNPTLENFRQVFALTDNLWVPFTRYLFNSVAISLAGTLIYMVVAALAGYVLAKGRFWGRSFFSLLVVWTMLYRGEVTAIPSYIIVAKLGLVDTYASMILPAMAGTMGVFLVKQFVLASVPDSTLEAARIDGASEYRLFSAIVVPSIKPALMTLLIFTFQSFWNGGGAYIYSEELKMLPSVLSSISGGGIARAGAGAAVAVLLMLPPIAVFIYSQSSVMETMTHSGLK